MENNILTNEKSYAISVVRCCAMLSIILCHVFNEIPKISFLGQFFNVGIVLFMIISGYLYGKKNIIDVRKWIVKRFKTICVPIYVYYVLTFLLYSILKINQPFEIKKSIIAIFNMQGIVNGGLSNIILSHLWFITYILICYCITPFLQYMRKKGKKNIYAFIITSIVIVAILQLKIGVQNVWTIIYYITAYFGSSFRKNIVSNKKAYFMIIFAIIMRLFMKYVLGIYDKFYVLNLLYENIIVPILQWILGIGIFLLYII